jgi:hypothetical protein
VTTLPNGSITSRGQAIDTVELRLRPLFHRIASLARSELDLAIAGSSAPASDQLTRDRDPSGPRNDTEIEGIAGGASMRLNQYVPHVLRWPEVMYRKYDQGQRMGQNRWKVVCEVRDRERIVQL